MVFWSKWILVLIKYKIFLSIRQLKSKFKTSYLFHIPSGRMATKYYYKWVILDLVQWWFWHSVTNVLSLWVQWSLLLSTDLQSLLCQVHYIVFILLIEVVHNFKEISVTFSNIVTDSYMVTDNAEPKNCGSNRHISLRFGWAQKVCATPLARKLSIEETWV